MLHDACRLPPDVDLQPLWAPLQLREVTLRNRVMCSATTLQYGRDGLLSDRHVAFYRERFGNVGLFENSLYPDIKATPVYTGSYDETLIKTRSATQAGKPPGLTLLLVGQTIGFARDVRATARVAS